MDGETLEEEKRKRAYRIACDSINDRIGNLREEERRAENSLNDISFQIHNFKQQIQEADRQVDQFHWNLKNISTNERDNARFYFSYKEQLNKRTDLKNKLIDHEHQRRLLVAKVIDYKRQFELIYQELDSLRQVQPAEKPKKKVAILIQRFLNSTLFSNRNSKQPK